MLRTFSRVGLYFLLSLIVIPFLGILNLRSYVGVYAYPHTRWSAISEGVNESRYGYTLMEVASAVKFVLYMNSSGDVNEDWIKIVVFGDLVNVEGSVISYDRYVVGYVKIGYERDGRGTTKGLHVIYYILPRITHISYVELVLHSGGGSPRLDVGRSWVEPLNITSTYWMYEDLENSRGTYYLNLTSYDAGELRTALFSQGGQQSQLSAYYGRAFKPEMGGTADVYVDVSYMGGFNIAPMSSYGTGEYTAKLDVGVKQSNRLDDVLKSPEFQTVLYMKGGGGWIEMPVGFAAERVEDLMLDLIVDYGLGFIKSPLGKAVFKSIPYINQIVEWIELFYSLTYDDLVNSSMRVVFRNVSIDSKSGNNVYVWTRFLAYTKSYLFSANLVNFCGDPPWQSILEKYFGVDVWRLTYGGIYVGGIVLHYFNVPEVISELPEGEVKSATADVFVRFSKPVDRGSLPPFENSIKVLVGGVERPFLEYFRYELDRSNTTLRIYPNYHLDYGRSYVIELTQSIRGVDGTNLVKPYGMWFFTERKQQVGNVTYYVLPTATAVEYRGKLFKALHYDNISVGEVGLRHAVLHLMESGSNVRVDYIGEAAFYTNDVNIDYYDGGFGRLYVANNTVWFIPFTARDLGLPPHSASLVFRLIDTATILNPQPARIVISWLKVGNSRVEKTLRDSGVFEGALLDLEPVPVMDYSLISSLSKVGEGVLLSESELGINGTRFPIYLVTSLDRQVHDLSKLLRSYSPLYRGLGGMPVDGDLFIFTIVNATYMRAWRLAPLGYVKPVEQPKISTYTIKAPELPAEVTLISNNTIKGVNTSNIRREVQVSVEGVEGSYGYLIITVPEQAGILVKSAVVDGVPVEIEWLNQTMFKGYVGVKLTYRLVRKESTIFVTFSTLNTSASQTYTTPIGDNTQTQLTLPIAAAVVVAVILVAAFMSKVVIRRS